MRYLSIISPQLKQLAVVDLKKPEKLDVIDGIYYAEKFNCTGLISNYKKPLNEPFKRTLKHGESKLSDLPKRLNTQQLIEQLESLLRRGKDKQARRISPNSLANLKPSRLFNKDNQPVRVPTCTPAMLARARQLRSDGCSWPGIGDILGVKAATIRMAMVRSDKVLKSD